MTDNNDTSPTTTEISTRVKPLRAVPVSHLLHIEQVDKNFFIVRLYLNYIDFYEGALLSDSQTQSSLYSILPKTKKVLKNREYVV